MDLRILQTNDFHGTLTPAKATAIRQLKESEPGTLYFDTGDCIKAGNLAIPLGPEKAWEYLAEAGCDASVLGNRETHVLTSAFKAKIAGHRHPILCANLREKDGTMPLPGSMVFDVAGGRVGVFGVMVPMVTERMATKGVSSYLWAPPLLVADQMVKEMRGSVDCLIALTHIGHRGDIELANRCPDIDVILGAHSHTVLSAPLQIGGVYVCQGGSHGKFIGEYRWRNGALGGKLLSLEAKPD